MKDDILKRLVTWATGVNTLNGTYTLSRDQYQELRAMQKDAMEALKPEPMEMSATAVRDLAVYASQVADYANAGAISTAKSNEILRSLYGSLKWKIGRLGFKVDDGCTCDNCK